MNKKLIKGITIFTTAVTTLSLSGCSKGNEKVSNIAIQKENDNIIKLLNEHKTNMLASYKTDMEKKVEAASEKKEAVKDKEPIQKKDPEKVKESQAEAEKVKVEENKADEVSIGTNEGTNTEEIEKVEEVNQPVEEESTPKAEENKSVEEENAPKAEENKSVEEESAPKAEENKSVEEESAPKAEEKAPTAPKDNEVIKPVQYIGGVPCGSTVNLGVSRFIQETYNYCAPTVVQMILNRIGINMSQTQLATEMHTYGDFGTYNKDAISVLNKYVGGGYKIERAVGTDSLSLSTFKNKFKRSIDNGNPLYLCIDFDTLYGGDYGDHALCGDGYVLTPDGKDIAFISYIDPSYSRCGGRHLVSPEAMLQAIVNAQEPNYVWK